MPFPLDLLLPSIKNDDFRARLQKRARKLAEESIGETMFCNDDKKLKFNYFLENLAVDKTVDKQWTSYLPLELMKSKPWLDLWSQNMPFRHFRSSGTSQQDRSLSPFSEEGLQLYKAAALCDFYQILESLLPKQQNPLLLPGISLIPTTKEWPDSSLAFMIDAFSQVWPLTYLTIDEAAEYFEKNQKPGQALWIFGTALHYINLFEKYPHMTQALPRQLYLFETGGSKSSSRRWSHPDFIKWLRDKLPHQGQQIISEYGMCELACQAYGVWQGDPTIRLSFAKDVEVGIVLPGGRLAKEGVGALAVADPLRPDLPFPLRTQDIVKLYADGSFEILERVPQSVLKGCSLRVSDLPISGEFSAQVLRPLPTLTSSTRKKFHCLDALSQFLNSEPAVLALQKETALTESSVKQELQTLNQSLPMTDEAQIDWLESALGTNQKWLNGKNLTGLFLAPKNHSLALIEALAAALCLGHSVCVRLPSTIGHVDNKDSLLASLIASWQRSGFPISKTSDLLRIEKGIPMAASYIYLHGDATTISKLKSLVEIPIFGFGSAITLLVTDPEELLKNAEQVIASMLHLGQWGCESLRAVLCKIPDQGFAKISFMETISRKLKEDFQGLLPHPLPIKWQLAQDHARLALARKNYQFFGDQHETQGPLLPFKELGTLDQLEQFLLPYLYTLPIVFYKENVGDPRRYTSKMNAYIHWMDLAGSNESKHPEIWHGLHQNHPIFHLQ